MQRYLCHVYDFLHIFHARSEFVIDKVRYGLLILCFSACTLLLLFCTVILIASKYGSWSSSPLSSIWDQCRRCYWWNCFIFHPCRDWDRETQFLASAPTQSLCRWIRLSNSQHVCFPRAFDGNSWFVKSYRMAAHCGRKLFRSDNWWLLWLNFFCRLWMITWHVGLFIVLTLGQIGFKGRKDGYWWVIRAFLKFLPDLHNVWQRWCFLKWGSRDCWLCATGSCGRDSLTVVNGLGSLRSSSNRLTIGWVLFVAQGVGWELWSSWSVG